MTESQLIDLLDKKETFFEKIGYILDDVESSKNRTPGQS